MARSKAEGKWHNIATMESDRRTFMKVGLAAAILPQASGVTSSVPRKGRIRQSVSRWCYDQIPLDQLCVAAAQMGVRGIDLLEVTEFDVPRRYGLICTMGYAGGGTIPDALTRTEHHAAIKEAFRKKIPIAAKAGVPNVITFSGIRRGMSDEGGARK